MSHVKTILFLLTALIVGIGVGKGYLYWKKHNSHDFTHIGEPPLVTGVGDAPGTRGFVVTDLSALPKVLEATGKAFGTSIGIEYSAGMTREALMEASKAIHKARMTVVLMPPPVFAARNPYAKPLAQVAADARDAKVDYLCISWLNVREDAEYWLAQAAEVRAVYNGLLIFAGTPAVLTRMECWDAADLFGAIGPLSIPRRLPRGPAEVSEHDLRVAWNSTLSGLESLAMAHKKKLALLRVNVPVRVSSKLPAVESESSPPPNEKLQRMLYDALLLETKGRAERTEVMLFTWGAGEDSPNSMPGMLQRIGDAWEPKTPKPAETAPATGPATAPESALEEDAEAAESMQKI